MDTLYGYFMWIPLLISSRMMDTNIDTIMDSIYRYQFTGSGYIQFNMDTSYFLWILQAYLKMSGMDTSVFLMDNFIDTFNRPHLDTSFLQVVLRFSFMDPQMDTIF